MKKLLLLSVLCLFAQVKSEPETPEMTVEQEKRMENIALFIPLYAQYVRAAEENGEEYTPMLFETNAGPINVNRYDSESNTFYFDKRDYSNLLEADYECSNVNPSNLAMCKRLHTLLAKNGLKETTRTSKGLSKYFRNIYGEYDIFHELRKQENIRIL